MNHLQKIIVKSNELDSKREELSVAQEDFLKEEQVFNKSVSRETLNLLFVGRNVLKKILSPIEFKKFERGYYKTQFFSGLKWLRIHDPKISFEVWRTDPSKGTIILKGFDCSGNYLAYSISADILNYSIREFAKMVRVQSKEALIKSWEDEILKAEETIERNKKNLKKFTH